MELQSEKDPKLKKFTKSMNFSEADIQVLRYWSASKNFLIYLFFSSNEQFLGLKSKFIHDRMSTSYLSANKQKNSILAIFD